MDNAPFTIQKFIFTDHQSAHQSETVTLGDVDAEEPIQPSVPGYFAVSTAPANIEDSPMGSPDLIKRGEAAIAHIARKIYEISEDLDIEDNPELIVTIHGYNTSQSGIEKWYKNIFTYINRTNSHISAKKNLVFLGYRWSSENVKLGSIAGIMNALIALPISPKIFLLLGFIFSLVMLMCMLFSGSDWIDAIFLMGLLLSVFFSTVVITLVILRLVVYFRDVYRATNFGVPDLVELLRHLDNAVIQHTAQVICHEKPHKSEPEAFQEAVQYWDRQRAKKIKLTFIGHSMGGLVVTNAVRILSDVFDTRSIDKQPPAFIGYVFQLERLILASPDIPILTIVSNRANFLSSSLRRFTEAYLFSSEGDIALRIASTAANYFTFPSATRSRGYRLGNVAIRPKDFKSRDDQSDTPDYGIVNLNSLTEFYEPDSTPLVKAIRADPDNILERLFVTNISESHHGTDSPDQELSLAALFKVQGKTETQNTTHDIDRCTIADLFTFFDCTDYVDTTDRSPAEAVGVLCRAKRKPALSFRDYVQLMLDYGSGKRDVHGGYFEGHFSKDAIYGIAFLGFSGFLKTFGAYGTQVNLTQLHQTCKEKGIQLFLSPLRYRVNVQGQAVGPAKAEIIADIRR